MRWGCRAMRRTADAKLTAHDGATVDLFGASVSVSGDTVVIGAEADDDRGLNSGSAYVFDLGSPDLDGSGSVDFADIEAVLAAWGNTGGPEDLDGSGIVDFADILVVLTAWGPCE